MKTARGPTIPSWLAFVLAAGCSDFQTVGTLAPDVTAPRDAGGTVDAGTDSGEQVVIDECGASNAAGLDAASVETLMTGGDTAGLSWLYPYDGTVFPGGVGAPLLMWKSPATADAVYVRLQSSTFDYQGCLKPTGAGQLQLPSEIWSLANAATAGAGDPFKLELSVLAAGVASGPIIEHIVIATGTLPGAVYYMTVGSKLTESGGLGTLGESAIIGVRPARSAELILGASGCTGCHGLSADGSRLVAYASGSGVAYALSGSSAANPPVVGPAPGAEYGAVVPDGTLYLATAHPAGVGPRTYGASAAMNATLYETATGNPVADAGVPSGAMVAAFSGDASLLAFNDFAINGGRGLALMAFSESARTASAYRQVFSDPSLYPAWPSFLPDAKALLFSLGQGSDFTGGGTGISAIITPGPATDLYVLDLASQTSTLLAQAMGFATPADASSNTTYLPFGAGELHQNYSPTVLPVTSGGYAWLFFDSRRDYGNLGLLRQIWGAAIDVSSDSSYRRDPSHPAFFLPGQEIGTGNFRPVATLDP
jgi:hypothetical protein